MDSLACGTLRWIRRDVEVDSLERGEEYTHKCLDLDRRRLTVHVCRAVRGVDYHGRGEYQDAAAARAD